MQNDIKAEVIVLLEKYINEVITLQERERLFNLLAQNNSEYEIKDHIHSDLRDFTPPNETWDQYNQEKVLNKILSKLKIGDISELERCRELKKRKLVRMTIFRASVIAALIIMAFFLGDFFGLTRNSGDSAERKEAFNEIKAPFGSRTEVSLPDGSIVLLNAGSTLRFSNNFNYTGRELFLQGEAYFKVSKNNEIPFSVRAGRIKILAVGTEFNVKAYDDEEIIETTLVEGKVKISRDGVTNSNDDFIDLNVSQKAIYIKETNTFSLNKTENTAPGDTKPDRTIHEDILISPKVDVDQVAAWTKGKLIIKGDYLEDLCIKLKRKYDVTFIFKDKEIKKFRFSGVLLDETLEQVLDAIKLTAPIDYVVSGKNVFLNTNLNELNNFSEHLKN